ncbi:MAG: hypothetical protein V4695_10195 [Pseudomonadota bacterium]
MNFIKAIAGFLVICSAIFTAATFAADDKKGDASAGKKETAHSHNVKPMHGGVVATANDINYELVARATELTLHVMDHDRPVDTQKSSAMLTMLSGTEKNKVTLAPAGKNMLRATGTFNVAAGTKVVAMVKMNGKPAQSVRFVLK